MVQNRFEVILGKSFLQFTIKGSSSQGTTSQEARTLVYSRTPLLPLSVQSRPRLPPLFCSDSFLRERVPSPSPSPPCTFPRQIHSLESCKYHHLPQPGLRSLREHPRFQPSHIYSHLLVFQELSFALAAHRPRPPFTTSRLHFLPQARCSHCCTNRAFKCPPVS